MRVPTSGRPRVPLAIKIAYTAWVVVLIPVWIDVQGVQNFLWLSDIGLIGVCLALWLESRLLASMMAVGVVLPDLAWTLLYVGRLLIDAGPLERAGYMFDDDLSLFVRGLSLYHIFLPPLAVWMVFRLGYHRQAVPAQTLLTWILLPVVYLATDPADNINFVFGFGDPPRPPVPQPFWLLAQMVALPLGVYLPMHVFLRQWARNHNSDPEGEETVPENPRA